MANKLTTTHITVGIVAVVSAGLIYIGYQEVKSSLEQTTQTQSEIVDGLRALNNELSGVKQQQALTSSPEYFQKAVIGAIENYGQQQQAQLTANKLARYEAAPEKLTDGKRIYGSMTAQFTLVEFSDIECGYCKKFHPTAKDVVDSSGGLINWEWKHMPLGFHQPAAGIQAHAAECVGELAGNRAFWTYVDDLFANTKGGGQGSNELTRMAVDLGVDANAFNACMKSGRHQKVIDDDVAMGTSLGVRGTPTSFLIDNTTGKRLTLSGAQPSSAVMSAVRSLQQSRQETDAANAGQSPDQEQTNQQASTGKTE